VLDVFVGELRVEGFGEFGKLSFGVLEPTFEGLLGVGLCDGVQGVNQEGSALSSGDRLSAFGLRRLGSGQDDHGFVIAQLPEAGIAERGRTKFFPRDGAGVTGIDLLQHSVSSGDLTAWRTGVDEDGIGCCDGLRHGAICLQTIGSPTKTNEECLPFIGSRWLVSWKNPFMGLGDSLEIKEVGKRRVSGDWRVALHQHRPLPFPLPSSFLEFGQIVHSRCPAVLIRMKIIEQPPKRCDMLGGRNRVDEQERLRGFRRELLRVDSKNMSSLSVIWPMTFLAHVVGHANQF